MTLNADVVRSRCAEIEESVSRLERFATMSSEDLVADQDRLDVACYRLLIAIEAATALCFHVSARRLGKVPEQYRECFEILREANLIPADLAGRLQQMARFRNLLVHMYWKVDYSRVHEIIRGSLGDLRELAAAMIRLV